MPESNPLPEIPECSVERTAEGLKVTHKDTGASEITPDDERRARLAGLRLRVSADLVRDSRNQITLWTGDPT